MGTVSPFESVAVRTAVGSFEGLKLMHIITQELKSRVRTAVGSFEGLKLGVGNWFGCGNCVRTAVFS